MCAGKIKKKKKSSRGTRDGERDETRVRFSPRFRFPRPRPIGSSVRGPRAAAAVIQEVDATSFSAVFTFSSSVFFFFFFFIFLLRNREKNQKKNNRAIFFRRGSRRAVVFRSFRTDERARTRFPRSRRTRSRDVPPSNECSRTAPKRTRGRPRSRFRPEEGDNSKTY